MYERIVILETKPDIDNGGWATVTLGFFDGKGREQLRVPNISGKLVPPTAKKGDSITFIAFDRLKLVSNT